MRLDRSFYQKDTITVAQSLLGCLLISEIDGKDKRASGIIVETEAYLGETDPQNPLASPLYAGLQGLPPLLIQVGTSEILLDDSRRIADRAKAAGVEVQLAVWDDMIHVFSAIADWAPEGQQGIDQVCEYIQTFFT